MATIILSLLTQCLSHTPTSKMTNIQTELSLRELSIPTAMKLFQIDTAPIWQQSYTFLIPVIKSGALSVQKSLYAQLIICKWTQKIHCDACQQLILFYFWIPIPILQLFKRVRHDHAMLHVTPHPTSMYLCCGELPFSCMNTVTLHSLPVLNEISNTTFAVKKHVYPCTKIPIWC